jgi:hypothetical protein
MSLSHQQRKGQWFYNALRPVTKDGERPEEFQDIEKYKAQIADALWNMTDKDFDKVMGKYFQ